MQKRYIKQKSRVSAPKSKLLSWLNATIVVCLAFSLIYYIAGVNDLMVKGFDLKKLKTEVRALALENDNYQSEVVAKKSLYNLETQVEKMNLVAISDVTYITVSDTIVAKK